MKKAIIALAALLVLVVAAGCASGNSSDSSAGSAAASGPARPASTESAAGSGASASSTNTAASAQPSPEPGTYRQISQEEAQSLMESETGYIILDVRTPQEFSQGHIPNAVNVAVETIGSEPPAELPDKNQLIMVYCRSGNRSKTASDALAKMGYTNVVEFGGINTWPGEVVTG